MLKDHRYQISSVATVAIVLILTLVLESRITFTLMHGALDFHQLRFLENAWLLARVGSVLAVILFWRLDRKKRLFQAIVIATILLTVGLLLTTLRVVVVLTGTNHTIGVVRLLGDVVVLAVVNVLTFSIWYWLIDPPGIDETQPSDAPWDFLFPQRADVIPGYEAWSPRYTDYVALAFSTSVTFGPADIVPLSLRAKALMISQSVISLISITVIAGSAIGLL